MKKSNIYANNDCFSIPFVLKWTRGIINQNGLVSVLADNKFKLDKEAWITAVFLIGLSKTTKKEYWVRGNPEDSTPDTYGISFVELDKGLEQEIINFEVFEWETHSKVSLQDHIYKKIKNKSYPEYFWLLCYAHSRERELIDMEVLYQHFHKQKFGFSQIWVLCGIGDNQNEYTITKLYPDRFQDKFYLEQELKKHIKQLDIIKIMGRGIDKKFKPLGQKFFPFPD